MSQTSALESQPDSWVMAQQPEESTSLFFLKLKSSAWTLRTLTCTVSEGHLASESQQWLWEFRWTTVLGRMGQEICAVAINPQSSETSETGLCLDHSPCSLWIGIYMRGRMGFPDGLDGKKICLQCGSLSFSPWVRKIPWRRKWLPTPEFLPGESHGQMCLAGYSPWGGTGICSMMFSLSMDLTPLSGTYWLAITGERWK